MQVPSGYHVLHQNCGEDQGSFLQPGGQWCWPAWQTVSHIVSKQVFTFNARPKSCPTRDAVFVDVNISINLSISSEFERVKAFTYGLGAERLDSYLYMQVEESIRTLVYGVTHDRVNDLRSEFAMEMLATLQSKLTPLGVNTHTVKVTDVSLPVTLQQRLEATTAFRTRITEEQKNHEHKLQQLENTQEQRMAEIHQKYNIEIQKLRAQIDRYEVSMDENMSQAESDRRVCNENILSEREVSITKAKGEIKAAEFRGRADKDDVVSQASVETEKNIRNAEIMALSVVTEAKATEDMAKNLAEARIESAKAEGIAAEQAEEKRIFEQKLALADIDANMAATGRVLLDSKNGGDEVVRGFLAVRKSLEMDRV